MSLETLLLIAAGIAVFAVFIIITSKKYDPGEENENGPDEEDAYETAATVADKRIEVNYGGIVYAPDDKLDYLIDFKYEEDGKESEKTFPVPKEDFEKLEIGKRYVIALQGDRYLGFSDEDGEGEDVEE